MVKRYWRAPVDGVRYEAEMEYAFMLRLEGLSHKEIGLRLGCNLGHARTLIDQFRRHCKHSIFERTRFTIFTTTNQEHSND